MIAEAREKIIRRIRKLLALARGGATEEEAAQATRRAHELLVEHNLDLAEVDAAKDWGDRVLDRSTVDGSREMWPVYVWNATAWLHFCRYFYTPETDGGRRIGLRHNVIGRRHNVEVTKLTAQYLVATVVRLADEAGRAVARHERRSFRDSFRRACGRRLTQRVFAMRHDSTSAAPTAERSGNLPALISLYEAETLANNALLARHGIELGGGGATFDRLTHAGGAEAGRLAAETIGLHCQVGARAPADHTACDSQSRTEQIELFA